MSMTTAIDPLAPTVPMVRTVEEVAPILRVNKSTVYRLCKDRILGHTRVGDRILIRDEDIRRYLDAGHQAPATPD
jgi:excisionase family DNA binding protein